VVEFRNVIHIEFTCKDYLPCPGIYQGRIPKNRVLIRFHDKSGDVTDFVNKGSSAQTKVAKLRKQFVATRGWRRIILQWQLKRGTRRVPTNVDMTQFAIKHLKLANIAATRIHGGGFVLVRDENLVGLINSVQNAIRVEIRVYQPAELLDRKLTYISNLV